MSELSLKSQIGVNQQEKVGKDIPKREDQVSKLLPIGFCLNPFSDSQRVEELVLVKISPTIERSYLKISHI